MPETSQEYVLSPRATTRLAIGLLVGTLLYVAVVIFGPLDLPSWLPLAVMGVCWWGLALLTLLRRRRSRSRNS